MSRIIRILRDREVKRMTGLSSERRRQLERLGLFPKRFKIVPGSGQNGAVGNYEHEVQEYLEERGADRELES